MAAMASLSQVSPSDPELVDRARQGDLDAYALLMTRYRLRFGRYAFHLLGNESDAEEALQDAFTLAYRSLERCRHPERFAAWLFRILVNRCRTMATRRRRQEARCRTVRGAVSGPQPLPYSLWSVIAGSTRAALRAGSQHAIAATAASSAGTEMKVTGSVGGTWNSWRSIRRAPP